MTKRQGDVVTKKGKGKVFRSGRLAVFGPKGCRQCCDCCKPKVLASFVANAAYADRRTWNLTPYQGPGIDDTNCPHVQWRLIETGAGLQYGNGQINSNGELVGLPNSFTTSYSYDGYMKLQLACKNAKTGNIEWP